MSKQIYIDSNGNEVLVSGTITTAGNLPLGSDFSDPTSTAGAIGGGFEQGTSGKFTYRKWRNGILEIWGIDHNTNWSPTWTAWGNGFYALIGTIGSYPVAFIDEPAITVSLQPKSGQAFAGITDGNFANRYTQAPTVGAYRFTTDGGGLNEYVLSIYAIGKWKN